MSDVLTKTSSSVSAIPGGRPIPVPEGVDPVMFARRMGRLWSLRVEHTANITPRMRRVQLTGDDLIGWSHKPGQEIILRLPQAGGEVIRRHYTIRTFDAARHSLDVDFVLHGESPATRWALNAKPGDAIDITGPRGRIVINPEAQWHLFAGDETCIPAILAMVESLPKTAQAYVFLEAGGDEDKQPFQSATAVTVEWLLRNGAPAGPSRILSDRLDAFALPAGRGHAYIIGETSNARVQRQALIARGFPREQISAEGYWRPGRIGGHDHVDDRG